jgi:hypothetical protein
MTKQVLTEVVTLIHARLGVFLFRFVRAGVRSLYEDLSADS